MKLLGLMLLLTAVLFGQSAPIPVIFDTDIGDDIDDALALALILQSPELDLKLVTTVADDVQSRTRLAAKELRLYGRGDIPLATGASEPLLDPRLPDNAPQFSVLTPADQAPAGAGRRASDAIIETLMKSPVKMTLIPVGPLTNIALALREEPKIREKIEKIVLMGGAYFPPRREYNIYRDRIAAQIVFTSGIAITGIGLDVTTRCQLKGADLEKIKAAGNPASIFLVQLIQLWQKGKTDQFPILHDPLAVAAALRPTFVETQTGTVQVETSSPAFYGATSFTRNETGTTRVGRDVDVTGFIGLLVERLASSPRVK